MRQSLFAGRRLRASYRNVPMDAIVALLEGTDLSGCRRSLELR